VTLAAALGCRRDRAGAARPSAEPVIAVVDVSKSYRHHSVLRHTSLEVVRGALVVLTGPNGAGKSTLLRIIAGIDRADSGTVRLRGPVGYAPQAGGLDPYLRPDEHFELFGAGRGMPGRTARREGERLATELGWHDSDRATVAGELSGGTGQKLRVITAMLGDPAVVLLDEPCQGMDADSTHRFWELLWSWSEAGRAAVVSSHQSEVLDRAHTVIELEEVGR
jgi:ABC-type multidrug transport system ATPase subunit